MFGVSAGARTLLTTSCCVTRAVNSLQEAWLDLNHNYPLGEVCSELVRVAQRSVCVWGEPSGPDLSCRRPSRFEFLWSDLDTIRRLGSGYRPEWKHLLAIGNKKEPVGDMNGFRMWQEEERHHNKESERNRSEPEKLRRRWWRGRMRLHNVEAQNNLKAFIFKAF